MALDAKNITFSDTGASYGTSGGDKVLMCGHFITADAAATVEAANYFNPIANRIPDGGFAIVEAIVGVGGTVKHKQYLLTRAAGVITATLLATAAG